MSESVFTIDPVHNLTPRRWSNWWLSWPKWFRIFGVTILGLLLLQIVLAIRISIGLMEADEVKLLRQRGAKISYPWDNMQIVDFRPPRSLIPAYKILREQYRWLIAGFVGRSAKNVVGIDMEHGTDRDLQFIGSHFPRIKRLQFWKSDFANDSLRHLDACPFIEFLDLSYTDLDDRGVEILKHHSKIKELHLGATLITDASIKTMRNFPLLDTVDLYVTDVSAQAIEQWKRVHDQTSLKIKHGRDELPIELGGVIRWSDGHRSANFSGPWHLSIEGPLASPENSSLECSSNFLGRNDLTWHTISHLKPGDYRFTLTLGGIESEGVTIHNSNDHPSKEQFELCMPVTKEQALQRLNSHPD